MFIYRLNLVIIFTSMGFVAHSPPNFAAAQTSLGVPPGPIVTELFAHLPLFSQVSRFRVVIKDFESIKHITHIQVNGIMNMVISFSSLFWFVPDSPRFSLMVVP